MCFILFCLLPFGRIFFEFFLRLGKLRRAFKKNFLNFLTKLKINKFFGWCLNNSWIFVNLKCLLPYWEKNFGGKWQKFWAGDEILPDFFISTERRISIVIFHCKRSHGYFSIEQIKYFLFKWVLNNKEPNKQNKSKTTMVW